MLTFAPPFPGQRGRPGVLQHPEARSPHALRPHGRYGARKQSLWPVPPAPASSAPACPTLYPSHGGRPVTTTTATSSEFGKPLEDHSAA